MEENRSLDSSAAPQIRQVVFLHVVGAGDGLAAVLGPLGVEEDSARLVNPLVGMGAKVVALGLQEIGGKACGSFRGMWRV